MVAPAHMALIMQQERWADSAGAAARADEVVEL
jgi:hypothetical protein